MHPAVLFGARVAGFAAILSTTACAVALISTDDSRDEIYRKLELGDRAYEAGDYATAKRHYESIRIGVGQPGSHEVQVRRCSVGKIIELASAPPTCIDRASCNRSITLSSRDSECQAYGIPKDPMAPHYRTVRQRFALAFMDHLKQPVAQREGGYAMGLIAFSLEGLVEAAGPRGGEWIEVLEALRTQLDSRSEAERTAARQKLSSYADVCIRLEWDYRERCRAFFQSAGEDPEWTAIIELVKADKIPQAMRKLQDRLFKVGERERMRQMGYGAKIAELLRAKKVPPGVRFAYERLAMFALGVENAKVYPPYEIESMLAASIHVERDASCAALALPASSAPIANADIVVYVTRCQDRLDREVRPRTVRVPGTPAGTQTVVNCPGYHTGTNVRAPSHQCVTTIHSTPGTPGTQVIVYDAVHTRRAQAHVLVEARTRSGQYHYYGRAGTVVTSTVEKKEEYETEDKARRASFGDAVAASAAYSQLAEKIENAIAVSRSHVRRSRAVDVRNVGSLPFPEALHLVMINVAAGVPMHDVLRDVLGFDSTTASLLSTIVPMRK